MITLITGLPGNGKTLYALAYVKNWSEKDTRPVFYSGINDLKLPWTEIESEKWFDCPANSIIVIDECQRVFRMRATGKEVPRHVAELETHRHKGVDIVLITQHPMLIDTAVRRLVGRHLHVVRSFGMQKATIHEFPAARENCDKPAGRKDSVKQFWKYDKSAFDYYKSAEVHTVKRSIPMRVYLLFLAPILIGIAVWFMWKFVERRMHPAKEEKAVAASAGPNAAPGNAAGVNNAPPGARDRKKAGFQNAALDAQQYAFQHSARVSGLPHTAPHYDEVTRPVTAPIPAACMAAADRCRCYSQQGTVIEMPDQLCREITFKGFFVDFEDKRESKRRDGEPMRRADAPVTKADAVALKGVENDSRVVVLPDLTRGTAFGPPSSGAGSGSNSILPTGGK